jgi:hypothetical protein
MYWGKKLLNLSETGPWFINACYTTLHYLQNERKRSYKLLTILLVAKMKELCNV